MGFFSCIEKLNMRLFFILFILLCYSCSTTKTITQENITYQQCYLYQSFPNNGSTLSLYTSLNNNEAYQDHKIQLSSIKQDQLNRILNNVPTQKHQQKKIPNVLAAGELWQDSKKEIFIIYNNRLLKLSSRIEYQLSDEDLKAIINMSN